MKDFQELRVRLGVLNDSFQCHLKIHLNIQGCQAAPDKQYQTNLDLIQQGGGGMEASRPVCLDSDPPNQALTQDQVSKMPQQPPQNLPKAQQPLKIWEFHRANRKVTVLSCS